MRRISLVYRAVLFLIIVLLLGGAAGLQAKVANVQYLPFIRSTPSLFWTEDWTGDVSSRWDYVTQYCYTAAPGTVHMVCESAAIYSKVQFDGTQPIEATVWMKGASAAISTSNWFWVGFTLLVKDDPDSHYVELAVERNMFYKDGAIDFVHLSFPNTIDTCCSTLAPALIPALEDTTYKVTIRYKPGRVTYLINDQVVHSVAVNIGGNPKVGILCVAEEPGTSKPGSLADCHFGKIIVIGVRI